MSKTLEELGYEKIVKGTYIDYRNQLDNAVHIMFWEDRKFAKVDDDGLEIWFDMEELKAIYKYCEDMGWI
jgi:hypothetical protein